MQSITLSPAQRTRVDALLDELLDLPPVERIPSLGHRRGEDPAVVAEVESLLRAANASSQFLSAPARLASEHAPADLFIGSRVDGWRIARSLGAGGMGEVYEAFRERGDFEQRVAFKVLQPDAGAQLERFQVERQILARLEHSGIARLYDGGVTPDGRPYMVIEYVEGSPITEYCSRNSCTLEQRLVLFAHVCEAVAYAHRNLVVHRDLKPSNILVNQTGEVKLLDFGIAKLIDSQRPHLTRAAATPLTPVCAAPEQLTGGPITTATDVYALGLLLFELLTGRHPWMRTDTPVLQALRTILQRSAPPASRMAEENAAAPVPFRLIRGDLDAIVAKALRTEPASRYATVESLKSDVERVARGAPVEARDGARLYMAGHMLRRYRWAVAALAAIFISLVGGLSAAAWQAHVAAVERDNARRDAGREEAVRYELTRMFRAAITDHGTEPPTAKNMIDNSSQRVLREYHDQPQLAGEIVLTLADLYGALEDVTGAEALLQGFVAEANPGDDPATLADARQKLANIELLRGHNDRARELLDQAEGYWAKAKRPYLNERLEGLGTRARLQRAQGDLPGSIATMREAIKERTALSGHDHRETAILYNSLAISLASNNELEDALAAYHETSAIYRALGLGDGLDVQIILANTGTLELRAGHLQEAEVLLKSAVERERSLAGDSAAVAAALGYYGKLLSVTNRLEPALAVLRESVSVGTRYAGADSPVTLQNRLFVGETQLAMGDAAAAAETLDAAHNAALAQYGAAHALTLRSQIALAQLETSAGHDVDALVQLQPAIAGLRKLGVPAQPSLALALETLGEVQLRQNQLSKAEATFREAVALRERAPKGNWELARAQERLAETLVKSGNSAGADLLRSAERDLELHLGNEHPQTVRAKNAVAALHD